jgi:small-conductance mechanosensitive channel
MMRTARRWAAALGAFASAWAIGAVAWPAEPPAPAVAAPGSSAAVVARATPGPGSAPPAASEHPAEATLRVFNRDVITMRGTIAGTTPAGRVERARARMRDITESEMNQPIRTVQATLGEVRGVEFLIGDRLLFSAVHDDVDVEARQSFEALVAQTQANLEEVRQAWHQARDRPLLARSVLHAAVATLVFGLAVWAGYRVSRVVMAWLVRRRDELAARHAHVDIGEFVGRVAVGVMQLVQLFVLVALAYAWLRYVLALFPGTAPLSRELGDWLWQKVLWVFDGLVGSLPGLVTVVIVLVLTRALADALGYFFDAINQGRLRMPMVHPETTSATRRIVTLMTWGLGMAIAYPYLPGSSSDAFKGLSVLFGLMVTLGSAGIVTQAMGGLVVVYSRALRKGDFVEVNGVQGVVTEVAALATKIVNVRNEEVTIPNAVLIGSPIRNFSKLGGTQGTLLTTKVTIGYDAPWRQIHALLTEAARRTRGVRDTPAPYVYQRALSDFYVEYELFVSIDRAIERVPILSDLHANIQDAFNERGVQIMSPHFFDQPDRPVVVPKAHWYAAPAAPPASQEPPR